MTPPGQRLTAAVESMRQQAADVEAGADALWRLPLVQAELTEALTRNGTLLAELDSTKGALMASAETIRAQLDVIGTLNALLAEQAQRIARLEADPTG